MQDRLQPQSLTRLIRDLEKDLFFARIGTALSTVLTPAEREAVLAASAIMLKLASHDHLKKDEQS